MSARIGAQQTVDILSELFTEIDALARLHNVEKIKTIGDSYFAVGWLRNNPKESAINIIRMAKEMILSVSEINNNTSEMDIQLRIGIHAGPVVTGVIGKHKFAYDLWGAAVNMASRMESTSIPGKIHISEQVKSLADEEFSYKKREEVEVKGVGVISSYFVE